MHAYIMMDEIKISAADELFSVAYLSRTQKIL